MELWDKIMDNQDKRISWQGIFKGIMQQPIDPLKAEDLAYEINKRLYEVYPAEIQLTQRPMQEKQRPARCPNCGAMAYYNNKGISAKSGAPYENWKCSKCKHIVWATKTYDQHKEADRARQADDDYEANQQENYEPRNFTDFPPE